MNRTLSLITIAAFGLFAAACSKKSDAEPEATAAAAPAGAPAPVPPNPQLNTAIGSISKDVQAQNFDSAITKLTEMKDIPKTPEEESEYRARLIETQNALAEKARTDEAARRQYQNLGRMMMGR